MPNTPLTKSIFDLLSHISLPAADLPAPAADPALADARLHVALPPHSSQAVLDGLLSEVETDLHEGRQKAAETALGLAGTRIALDRIRGDAPPPHVEWVAAYLRSAAEEMLAGHPGKALAAVRLARLAVRA